MKSESIVFKPRIDLKNRTPLQEVIPLETPFVLFVDPSDRCFLKCKFCPSGDHNLVKSIPGRNRFMTLDLFKKILNQLDDFEGKIKVLRLYKDGEPLYNPDFFKMVEMARESNKCQKIDTTTNAVLLTNPKILKNLIKSPLDRVNISVYGMSKQAYQNFCGISVDFQRLKDAIINYCVDKQKTTEVIIKINGDIISEEEKKIFIETFGPYADGVYIEHIMECWPEFDYKSRDIKANTQVGIYGNPIQRVEVCPYIFYSMAINSDGSVSACFLDWNRALIIGNIIEDTIKNIWQGDAMNIHRVLMLKKQRKTHPICANCGQLTHGMPDNIDDFADDLICHFKQYEVEV